MNKNGTTVMITAIIIAYLATIYFKVLDANNAVFITFVAAFFCAFFAIAYEFGKPKPPTTLTTLPPEPTDWVTIDTGKGHWWDGIHEMD